MFGCASGPFYLRHRSALVKGFRGGSDSGQIGQWPSLSRRIEVLRKAQLEADKARLEQVASAQVSYGHSDGRVETKEQFINGVMTRKQVVKSLAFPELKVAVVGNAAGAPPS